MKNAAFSFHKTSDVPFYCCSVLEALPGLRHGFSTRRNVEQSVSDRSFNLDGTDWNAADRVDEYIRRFLSALNLQDATLATVQQIHSSRIHIIKEVPEKWNPPEGDALITENPVIALAVRTADCFPILIADSKSNVIAAVHSGWRGALHQIVFHTVREIQHTFGRDPADLHVAIGPGIRSCCFEVGPDVHDLFEETYPEASVRVPAPENPVKFKMDLPDIIRMQLRQSGIKPENIHDLGLCTCCNTDTFFSYRAEGERSGRMFAVIGRA